MVPVRPIRIPPDSLEPPEFGLAAFLGSILDSALKLLPGAATATIHLLHDDNHISLGAERRAEGAPRVSVPEALPAEAARAGEMRLATNGAPRATGAPPEIGAGLAASLPLGPADKPVGVMTVAYAARQPLAEGERQLLRLLGGQAAAGIENARLMATTARQLKELALLHQVATAGAQATDEDELIERATQIIGAELYPDNFGVLVLDEGANVLRVHRSYVGVDAATTRYAVPLGQGITGHVAVTGAPWRTGSVQADGHYVEIVPDMRSELAVPILASGRVIGVINAESTRANAFSATDERLLATLAGQLASAIDRLRAEAARRRAAVQAAESRAALYRASQAISGSLDPEAVYAATHQSAAELMACDAFVIGIVDEAGTALDVVYAVERGRREAPRRVALGQGLLGHVAATGQPLLAPNAADLEAVGPFRFGSERAVASAVAAPMQTRGRVYGALSAQSYAAGAFHADDLETLRVLAHQAAVAIEHARLYEAEREERQLAEALRETGASLSASLELDDVLDRLLEQAARVAPYDTATILLLDGDRLRVARHAGYEQLGPEAVARVEALSFDLAATPTLRAVVAGGRPVVIDDAQASAEWVYTEAAAHIRGWIGAPLIAQGEVIGLFSLDRLTPAAYQAKHARNLATLAAQAALAVRNAQLFAAERRRVGALTALHETGLQLSQQLQLATLLRTIVQRAIELLGADGGGLYLQTAQAATLECVVSINSDRSYEGFRLKVGEGLVGRVAATGAPLVEGNYHAWEGRSEQFAEAAFRSLVGAPIVWQHRVMGVLVVTHGQLNAIGADAVEIVSLFAAQAAVAIANARLYADLDARVTELGHLYGTAQEMAACREPGQVLQVLARRLTQALDTTSAYIMEVRVGAGLLVVLAEHWSAEATAAERVTDLGREYHLWDYPTAARAVTSGQSSPIYASSPKLADSERREIDRYGVKSTLLVPIMARGVVLGLAELWESRRARTFGHAEIRLAETMVRQAADVIENARLFAAVENDKRQLELLYGLSQRLTASLDLNEVAQRALELVRGALGAAMAQMFVPVPGTDRLRLAAASGPEELLERDVPPVPFGHGLAGRAALTRQPLIVPDLRRDAQWQPLAGVTGPATSAAAVPLVVGDSLVGVFTVVSVGPAALGDEQRPALAAVAAPMALALQNALLFTLEAQRSENLALLNEIARAAVGAQDSAALLQTLADRLGELMAAQGCYLALWDETSGALVPGAGWGPARAAFARLRPQSEELGPARQALEQDRVLVIEAPGEAPEASERTAAFYGAQALLALPLTAGGRPLGAAVIAYAQAQRFAPADMARAEQAGSQLALAIGKGRLFDETRRRADELSLLVDLSVALRTARTAEAMLPIFLEKARQVCAGDAASIYLIEPGSGALVMQACSPPNAALTNLRLPPGRGITGHVAATGEAYITGDILADPLADFPLPAEAEYLAAVRSSIAVPLRTHDGVVGVMHVAAFTPHAFTPTEVHALTAMAEMAGNALQRANLLETLEQRVTQRTAELARANERLQHLDRLKDQFISNVSHELRTPLTNIKLHLGQLEKRGAEGLDRYLPTLQRETERLRRLIEDLLDLSRLQAQVSPPRREPHSLDGLAGEVIGLHSTRAEARGIALRHRRGLGEVLIAVDRAQMLQLFTNLVGNAVAYTPAGGAVTITTSAEPRDGRAGQRVRVTNEGVTIPPEDLPHLFERFFRGQTGIASGEAGTGLGLAICKEIVEQHGGKISAASADGTGTVFEVWLPEMEVIGD
jgi:GAF domain-containing protein